MQTNYFHRPLLRWAGGSCLLALLCLLLCLVQAAPLAPDEQPPNSSSSSSQARLRIISLAPHITETLFQLDAGELLVAVDESSRYPAAAQQLPRVGDAYALNMELILSLRPDLVLYWQASAQRPELKRLAQLGIGLRGFQPRRLQDIPNDVLTLGRLTGRETKARELQQLLQIELQELARARRQRLAARQAEGLNRLLVTAFVQLWHAPLISINGETFLADLLNYCGVENIFADLPQPSPQVSLEAVLARDPSLILLAGNAGATEQQVAFWRQYKYLQAVKENRLIALDEFELARPSPRLISETRRLCEYLDARL